jgi:hypothetical protein
MLFRVHAAGFVRLLRTFVLICCAPAALRAQDSARVHQSDWMLGWSMGVPGYRDDFELALFTLGAHFTQLRPGPIGADFSIGTAPYVALNGLMTVGVRAGLALPLMLSSGPVFVPSVGVSLIGGAVPDGGGFGTGGLNAGLAAVFFGRASDGLRLGVTWHKFADMDGTIWLVEIGSAHRSRTTSAPTPP